MASAPCVLVLKGICKAFPGVVALRNVDLALRPGEIHGLVGENGAGKSTLLGVVGGWVKKDAGEISVGGDSVALSTPKDARKLGIRVVPQDWKLVPAFTAAENIALGEEPTRGLLPALDRKEMTRRARSILETMNVDLDITVPVSKLGVLERQIIEIAKALSGKPRILILDEPTASLTEREIQSLFRVLKILKSTGIGIIYVSHHLNEVFQICDRVSVLRDGEMVATRDTKELDRASLIELILGRGLREESFGSDVKRSETVLSVRNISTERTLKDVSLDLFKGEILGIAGLLGSGASSVGRAVFGAERITAGQVLVRGKPVCLRDPRDAIAEGIGYLSDDRRKEGLVLPLSVRENTSLVSLSRICRFGIVNRAVESSTVADYAKRLKIRSPSLEQKVMYLSGGNQQKVVMSKWLYCDAGVLVFDHPTKGIDVGSKQEIYTLLRRLADEGRAIVVISTDCSEIARIADRVLVMYKGRIAKELSGNAITEAGVLYYAGGKSGDCR